MINVQPILLQVPTGNDFTDKLTVGTINAAVHGFAEKVKEVVHAKACVHHPFEESVLRIIANKLKIASIDKSGFCCQEFADVIQITIQT